MGRVHCGYPPLKLLIELDSRRHHSAKLDLDADRERDNRLLVLGWRVLRFTWDDITNRPDWVTGLLLRALRASGVGKRQLLALSVPSSW